MKHKKLTLGLAIVSALGGISTASAVPLPGGSLDPLTIPKYVTPLVIPPVMNNNGTANNYDIAVRQFQQQILPGGIWNSLNGRTDAFPATTVWSYGPATDPLPTGGVAPAANSQFNYPAYTVENLKDTTTTVNWINDLKDPTTGNFLPHLLPVDQTLHWANPSADCLDGVAQTDCAGRSAARYTGPVPIVTHVHGAHVPPDSDGYTEAWWLPDPTGSNFTCVTDPALADAANHVYVCQGTLTNGLGDGTGNGNVRANTANGVGNYVYPNTQPSTTLWYHDHALGMTRSNVYAGPAGFWLIRDTAGVQKETGLPALDINGNPQVLPGPAPVAGQTVLALNVPTDPVRRSIREIPIVVQDRSFNIDGSLFYPDNRAFFEGVTPDLLNIDFIGLNSNGTIPAPGTEADTSDISPIWNPEAFFNTMVVNGVSWPQLEVAPALYRFRLLDGCNSRFLNLALIVTDPVTGRQTSVRRTVWLTTPRGTLRRSVDVVKELELFQIGAEQSLLPAVVKVSTGYATTLTGTVAQRQRTQTKAPDRQQALLMGLAERADVIVDFRGLPNGTVIRMINTAPDAPFGGFPDVPADPSTTGQVMQFVVNNALLGASPTDEIRDPVTGVVQNPATAATSPYELALGPVDGGPINTAGLARRQLALLEEESALVCVTIDAVTGAITQVAGDIPVAGVCATAGAVPFAPKAAVLGTVDVATATPSVTLWSDPVATSPTLGSSEIWDINNFTVDAHPIHVHLVKFNVVGRALIGGGASIVSTPNGLQPWEAGWKDTVIAYPGEVTSVASTFDIPGLYVWHCHIVEHEDNEMMVPYCVGGPTECPNVNFQSVNNLQ